MKLIQNITDVGHLQDDAGIDSAGEDKLLASLEASGAAYRYPGAGTDALAPVAVALRAGEEELQRLEEEQAGKFAIPTEAR